MKKQSNKLILSILIFQTILLLFIAVRVEQIHSHLQELERFLANGFVAVYEAAKQATEQFKASIDSILSLFGSDQGA